MKLTLTRETPYEVRHRRRLTRLLIATLLACLLVLVWWGTAHGQERYTPSSRSARWENEAVERWRPLVAEYSWDVDTAMRVLGCESGGDPTVWNRDGSGAHGLFQLLGWEWLAFKLYGVWDVAEPRINVALAFIIWRASGERFDTSMGWRASVGCWAW